MVEKWLLNSRTHWQAEEFGWWILEYKIDKKAIGWCGLRRLENTDQVELLYLLAEKYWSQGLATEAARVSVEYGFHSVGLEEVICLVLDGNISSSRVLEKCGFCFEVRAEYFNLECFKYKIDRSGFVELYSND